MNHFDTFSNLVLLQQSLNLTIKKTITGGELSVLIDKLDETNNKLTKMLEDKLVNRLDYLRLRELHKQNLARGK